MKNETQCGRHLHSLGVELTKLPLTAYQFMKSILASWIHRVLKKLGEVFLLPAMFALGIAPVSAMSASVASPVISIATFDAMLAPLSSPPVFTWRTDLRPLEFDAAVSRTDSSPVDVYFGIIIPGGRIFSWSPGTASVPNLQEGFSPAAQGTTATEMSSAALLGRNPQHLFTADHLLGLYSVFFFLVPTGADPRDPRRWIGATMSPLVISN